MGKGKCEKFSTQMMHVALLLNVSCLAAAAATYCSCLIMPSLPYQPHICIEGINNHLLVPLEPIHVVPSPANRHRSNEI